MKYIALLRGINAGKNRRVEMKKLKVLFESLGFTSISTYINSGNVVFNSNKAKESIRHNVEKKLNDEFGFDIPALIKTEMELQKIAEFIPTFWQNDTEQRTDVAYLFDEIDSETILYELPVNREFIDVRYVKGAVLWNINRNNYNKSRLNRLIDHDLYQRMTVRNVNTARFLAGLV